MRTLLIDNFDSYTYNLFQLIAGVNGVEPTVRRNDELAGVDFADFDNIVISPGPGHAGRDRDFGGCARVLAETHLPVLGVCLGHQGLAVLEGATVDLAPRARHGFVSRVEHDGKDLFAGLPQKFEVVRYHSLAVVEPLPSSLEVTARAEDGVVMGLRHRHRPLWGVQFHPESICSQFGHELVANFAGLTRRGGRRERVTAAPQPTVAATPSATRKYFLHVSVVDEPVDTEAAFAALYGDSEEAFWLDSSHVETGRSRFSFFGDAAGPNAESVSYRVGGPVRVRAGGVEREEPGTIFDYLQRELAARQVVSDVELPFDFQCGYVGYFGYELKADLGAPGPHRPSTPDAYWLFADRQVAVDHQAGQSYVLALSDGGAASEASAKAWVESVALSLRGFTGPAPLPVQRRRVQVDVEPWLRTDRDRYLDDIAESQRQLIAGESYEICLTNQATVPATTSGFELYRSLRRGNPAPYAAYLRLGRTEDGVEIACSSPERFLKVDADRVVETKPIKGTAPRGQTPSEDLLLRAELAGSAKTRAENLMIVDLLRNDLGRVCEVGSVHVPRLMTVESYATVHQLVSTVRGTLRADTDVLDCVRACFPGGSMTGAPKLRTMEIIDRLETGPRGVYSGAIGFLACNGTADLNIVIRTGVLRDGQWQVGAGGAIVLDSDPAEEFAEMELKAGAWLAAHTRHDTEAVA
ncbi:aminodeoxychorismate synthase component I [Actinokineospora diospyrosa]|uniref:aminodeoxychorismate synthase n=1 Tax=Actinokineospora diospyrosa TaxID=103728 RepID=A0ABT1ILG1_9PSEU|nr:aminodeoxychorismate synthase component I [Actinokineospora diospyrosa]MCP2273494.1 para-aminobenzoate synthetase [Actinokineospora diospyrosa]